MRAQRVRVMAPSWRGKWYQIRNGSFDGPTAHVTEHQLTAHRRRQKQPLLSCCAHGAPALALSFLFLFLFLPLPLLVVGAIVAVLAIGIGIYMMKKGPKTAPGTKGVA